MFEINTQSLISRLRKRYNEQHEFNCICKCKDSTICKYENGHTVDVWTNGKMVKFLGDDEWSYATVETEFCPICGEKLNYKKGTLTNGMRVI